MVINLTNIVRSPIMPIITRQIQLGNITPIHQLAHRHFATLPNYALVCSTCASRFIQHFSILSPKIECSRFIGALMAFMTTLTLGNRKEIHAQPLLTDEEAEIILNKDHRDRTIEQSLELYNYLLTQGKKEAEKVRSKDVAVFFGLTGAGKSTWVNALHGCELIMNDQEEIIVNSTSSIKEIVPIGLTGASCTWTIQVLPDMISFLDNQCQKNLTVLDTPGLDDNRGVEVTMANAMVLREVLKNVNSARFILTFEEAFSSKGGALIDLIKLLRSRLGQTFGKEENSVCMLITKRKSSLENIKRQIIKYCPDEINLSKCTSIYDPLKPEDRKDLIFTIFKKTAHKNLKHNQIAFSDAELFNTLKIGETIAKTITLDLEQGDKADLEEIVKKIQFTYCFSVLGNKDLQLFHETASTAVIKHARKIASKIDPSVSSYLQTQISEFKKYSAIRSYFRKYVPFDQLDEEVRNMRRRTWHPYGGVDTTRPEPSLISSAITTVSTAVSAANPSFSLVPLVGASFTAFLTKKYISPSAYEEDFAAFFRDL